MHRWPQAFQSNEYCHEFSSLNKDRYPFFTFHYRYSLPLLFFAQDIEEERTRLVEEEVSKARKEWSEQQSCSNQTDIDDQIAAARQEWIKEHNDELEKRLSNAIEEVRRIWDEEQKLKTKEVRNLPLTF